MYVAKGSALSEDITTNCWQGLDDGSLTCTLIGWHRALRRNSVPPVDGYGK